jgi:hypothetical protein
VVRFFYMDDNCADFIQHEWLRRRVTLSEYFAFYLERAIERGRDTSDIERTIAELEARAQDGDEWWEWIMGDEPLMQMGGLALVRNGRVVWTDTGWIS